MARVKKSNHQMEALQQRASKAENADASGSIVNAEEMKNSRKRRRIGGTKAKPETGIRMRVQITPNCCPGISLLTRELGYRSNGQTVEWLLSQVRPDLILPNPNSLPTHRKQKPVCMAYPEDEKIVDLISGGPRQPVRVTVVQASTVFLDTPATLDKAERLVASAAAYGSQLVVFPEAFVGGYPYCVMLEAALVTHSTNENEEFLNYHASAIDVPGPEVDRLAKIAGRNKVQLVMGVVERVGSYLFSTILFFDSLGQFIGKNQKVRLLASECAVWWSGGTSSVLVYEGPAGKIGGLVGWDNRIPRLRTELYARGIEIYCAPAVEARDKWQASVTHIALEGGCFVLSANQFCRKKDYRLPEYFCGENASQDAIICSGGSVIISPSGTILAGPNFLGESLISADLDLEEIARAKLEAGIGHNFG
ncbi:bifunctional nitrilase/nitrile hydratase NIT4B-like [Carica papaya]|uniref:bifunctional nitrilase/nitrile hydratase NIT4B-like n=1 Tax=Carica papaya TaxID=3649 RepID=UPI000B8C9008|nr:bifunctional nitrilase/nitrile hydratase NIT4B-like [Carica papaya]